MSTKDQHIQFGNRLRLLLSEAGISQRELARTMKVGPNQVSRWVVGAVAPTYTVLVDILKICNLEQSAEWLLTGKGESPIKDKPSMDLLETKDKLISNLEDTATSEPDTKNELIKTLKEFNVHLREENAELKKEIIALRGG